MGTTTGTMTSSPAGVLLIDKPVDWTSHDVVARLRSVLRQRRVGHAGTLDPFATGLLVLGFGAGTRLLPFLQAQAKTYEATIRFGRATDTDDPTGRTVGGVPATALELRAVTDALAALTGSIRQRPSSYSAVKVDGVRSYTRARAGEAVDLPERPVIVDELRPVSQLRAVPGEPGEVEVDVVVTCSAGTYVRALARDAGAALGVGGHLTALRRTAVGGFHLADAQALPDRGADPAPVLGAALTLAEAAGAAMPVVGLSPDQALAVRHGQRIPSGAAPTGPVALVAGDALAAVAESADGVWRYRSVFPG